MFDLLENILKAPIDQAIDFILNQKNVNAIVENEMTMLHYACHRSDGLPLVELLLYLGIDRERKNKANKTALDIAKGGSGFFSFVFSLLGSTYCTEAIPILESSVFLDFSEKSRNILSAALSRPMGNSYHIKLLIREIRGETSAKTQLVVFERVHAALQEERKKADEKLREELKKAEAKSAAQISLLEAQLSEYFAERERAERNKANKKLAEERKKAKAKLIADISRLEAKLSKSFSEKERADREKVEKKLEEEKRAAETKAAADISRLRADLLESFGAKESALKTAICELNETSLDRFIASSLRRFDTQRLSSSSPATMSSLAGLHPELATCEAQVSHLDEAKGLRASLEFLEKLRIAAHGTWDAEAKLTEAQSLIKDSLSRDASLGQESGANSALTEACSHRDQLRVEVVQKAGAFLALVSSQEFDGDKIADLSCRSSAHLSVGDNGDAPSLESFFEQARHADKEVGSWLELISACSRGAVQARENIAKRLAQEIAALSATFVETDGIEITPATMAVLREAIFQRRRDLEDALDVEAGILGNKELVVGAFPAESVSAAVRGMAIVLNNLRQFASEVGDMVASARRRKEELEPWTRHDPLPFFEDVEVQRKTQRGFAKEIKKLDLDLEDASASERVELEKEKIRMQNDLARATKELVIKIKRVCTLAFDHFPEHRHHVNDVLNDLIESNGVLVERSLQMYDVDHTSPLALVGLKGSRNNVYKARVIGNKDAGYVVLKEFPHSLKDDRSKRHFIKETGILSRRRHRFIVEINCAFFDGKSAFIEMPYYAGGTLREWMDREKRDILQVHRIVVSVLEGLHFLHENGVIHCDIKPENIFLTESGVPVIGDFDVSRSVQGRAEEVLATSTVAGYGGTLGYIAPELMSVPHDMSVASAVTPLVDTYSLGVVISELIACVSPEGVLGSSLEQLQDLGKKLRVADPSKRLSSAAALAHPFCTSTQSEERKKYAELQKRHEKKAREEAERVNALMAKMNAEERRIEEEKQRLGRERELISAEEKLVRDRGEKLSREAAERRKELEASERNLAQASRAAAKDREAVQREAAKVEKLRKEQAAERERLKDEAESVSKAKAAVEAGRKEILRANSVPPHWDLQSLGSAPRIVDCTREWRDRMQDLMMSTCKPQFIGQGRDNRGLKHKGYSVVRVSRIENPLLWKRFLVQREAVVGNLAPGKSSHNRVNVSSWASWQRKELSQHKASNEAFFFHGTKPDFVSVIANHGIDERVCSLNGLFGAGIYLAENSSKSDEYCTPNSSGRCFMFLVRAAIGTPSIILQPRNDLRRPPCIHGHDELKGVFCTDRRCDSVLAPTECTHRGAFLKKYREFVVYDKSQCYPEFIIEFKRV